MLLLLLIHADVRILLVVAEKVNFEVSLRAESVATDVALVRSFACRKQRLCTISSDVTTYRAPGHVRPRRTVCKWAMEIYQLTCTQICKIITDFTIELNA